MLERRLVVDIFLVIMLRFFSKRIENGSDRSGHILTVNDFILLIKFSFIK